MSEFEQIEKRVRDMLDTRFPTSIGHECLIAPHEALVHAIALMIAGEICAHIARNLEDKGA
jgi:hypothetical protein